MGRAEDKEVIFMLKNGSKKLIAVMAATTLSLGCVSALAQEKKVKSTESENIVTPRYVAITATDVELSISGNTANCYGYTKVQSGYKAEVVLELQKTDGTTIKTWSSKANTLAEIDKDYSISSSYSYKLKATHRAYTSAGILVETVTTYAY